MPAADPLSSTDLVAFVLAMECGSVHGTADGLGLTSSAVSKRLKALERRTGVVLFERGRYGLRSTAAARALYPEAKAALIALDAAESAVREHRGHPRSMPLAASHTIGEFLLPTWLAAFRQEQPDVRVQIDIVNSARVIAAVRDGDAEIGFIEDRNPTEGLEAITLVRDELVVVVDAGHPWARRRVISAHQLLQDRYLARETGSGTRAVATAALAEHAVELAPALEAASSQSLKRALESGGFALMSILAVGAETQAGTLHTLTVRDVDLTRELRAVRRADREHRRHSDATQFWHWLERRRP